MKYFHLLTSSQWQSMQWNSPLVHNGMPQGTINRSRSSMGNWVSSLHNWLLLANAINYSWLLQLIALCNLTNPTSWGKKFISLTSEVKCKEFHLGFELRVPTMMITDENCICIFFFLIKDKISVTIKYLLLFWQKISNWQFKFTIQWHHIFCVIHIYQLLRSGRIWHKVNF